MENLNEGQLAALIFWIGFVMAVFLFVVWDAWNLKKKGII